MPLTWRNRRIFVDVGKGIKVFLYCLNIFEVFSRTELLGNRFVEGGDGNCVKQNQSHIWYRANFAHSCAHTHPIESVPFSVLCTMPSELKDFFLHSGW